MEIDGRWTNSNIRTAVTDGPFAVQICQRCTFDPKKEIPCWPYIRFEQNCIPYENAVGVFLTWTILQIEMNSDFNLRKLSRGQQEGILSFPMLPLSPLCCRYLPYAAAIPPMHANHNYTPSTLRGT